MRMNVAKRVRDQRGVALPIAMLVLVVLMALTFAFSTLATTEGVVGRNHSMAQQGRAFAESGVERAIWALNNSQVTFTGSTADQADYRAANFLRVSANGGFRLTITADTVDSNVTYVTSVGWAPDDTGQLRAVKKIETTIMRNRWGSVIPPCALCVMGTLEVGGNAQINAQANACGSGTPQGGSMTSGTTTVSGAGKVYGPGDSTPNQTADMPQNQPSSSFSYKMTADEFNTLRALARANNAYYQGAVTFNSSNLPPNGIVFVDTTTGQDLTQTTPSAEQASVSINGNVTWSGWLIVAGGINISGTVNLTGTLYAQNDFVFTGNGDIRGSITTENRIDTVATVVDSTLGGSANITYDCAASQTGGSTVSSSTWFMKAGTFREAEGS